jgi:cell division transport system permease protein
VISAYLNNADLSKLVDKVTYNQNQLVINRLATIVDTVRGTGLGLTVALSVISVLVTLNTIILTIYSTREEIGVMSLVGASNKFIRGTYLVQGALYGFAAAIFSMVLMAPLIFVASPYIKVLMPEMNLLAYFYGNLPALLGYQLLFGVVLGSFSSAIAVRKYLKI